MVSIPVGETSEAVARIARPIHGEDELDQLLDLVGPARIVLIGEASHGTHEFYDLRASLTRKLISERGFAAVAIEGDWPDALQVDRYVRRTSEDESAIEALSGFRRFPTWMWRNEAVATFVEWLRGHNARRFPEERAGFYGIDLYSLHASMAAVLSYLGDVDPDAAARARSRYACFEHAKDAETYGVQAHLGVKPDCEEEVIDQLVEMQRRRAARSGLTPGGDAWFHAMQNAHVVRDAEAYYRTMFRGRSASWNLRDTHMADTVDLLATHLGSADEPAKIVVWAHNSHVGDARATEMGKDDGQITLGQLMRQRHGEQAALIGMTTHRGDVECAHDWDEPGKRERVRPSLPGSWEELFHGTGIPRFLVTSAALKRAVGESADRLHRAIGVVYRPETERRSHYYDARLADQYDVVIHIDETHAVRPLDRPMPAPSPSVDVEPPETYPTGM